MAKLKIAIAKDKEAPLHVRNDAATYVLDQYIGKPIQPTRDETPRQNPFEGWPVEQVRGVLELLRTFEGKPQDLELFMAQARVAAKGQEARA